MPTLRSKSFGERFSSFRSSLQAAVGVNSSAFGFSIMITATLATVAHVHGNPDGTEVLLFAAGGIAAFTLLDMLATDGFKRPLSRDRPETVTHAASFSFVSVGLAIGAAIGLAHLLGGLVVWPLTAFGAAAVFVLFVALELAVAEAIGEEDEDGRGE